MKIATWNVNSIRTRLEQVIQWLTGNPIEVLCLQETKVIDADFPQAPFQALGYQPHFVGQKSYNGVAILSQLPVTDISTGFAAILGDSADVETQALAQQFDEQKRVITGVVNGVRIVNLYVPNGSEVGSEKYQYKLAWLSVLRPYLEKLLGESGQISLCGDFNIALENRDIYTDQGRETHIMSSEAERQALRSAVLDLGFADAFRKFTQAGGHFSWWDYRTGGFQRNRGWRIDHHYLSPALYERAIACTIDIAPRRLEKPSDHTPVIIELDLA
ncbi:exodeoxyribonuclease III [Leptolyngbya sp. 'hensonii']|nr:exodeoxyribonuclease III [Leptolyngbya sp. 'hensonii']OLP18557.1 exodeoxyribonuclease III [Leptolyngbya sp. 'hensonii']